jgi:phosphatidylserine decarboxylase
MTIHKEGYRIISETFIVLVIINLVIFYTDAGNGIMYLVVPASVFFFVFVTLFFRSPQREKVISDSVLVSPADGEVLIIEEMTENEYFTDRRLQVSIFMSAYNVHVNWYPVSGIIRYFKYHPGKYIVAWHPKSSDMNEHTSIVIQRKDNTEVMLRQIAGYIARRIVSYAEEGKHVVQGDQLGFIKFGSRVDIFLPIDSKLKVSLHDKVEGAKTIIAELPVK